MGKMGTKPSKTTNIFFQEKSTTDAIKVWPVPEVKAIVKAHERSSTWSRGFPRNLEANGGQILKKQAKEGHCPALSDGPDRHFRMIPQHTTGGPTMRNWAQHMHHATGRMATTSGVDSANTERHFQAVLHVAWNPRPQLTCVLSFFTASHNRTTPETSQKWITVQLWWPIARFLQLLQLSHNW